MTEATVAADVHQTLDVHRRFAAQVTFDGEQSDLVTDFFQVTVSQVFDFFGIGNLAGFANFASARAANAKNSSQADFSMLLRRNIDTSDTSHINPLKLLKSALTLFVTRVCADHADDALATNNFAVAANFLDRS
jgi:hypothetical protein